MENKVVYIVTTPKCSVCKLMEYILKDIQKENNTFTVEVCEYQDVPLFIKDVVTFTDFPTIVFTKNKNLEYWFVGSLPKRLVKNIIQDINY